MKKLTANGTELAYTDEGAGEALVFLHAFPLNHAMWNDQVSAFSKSRRVITFDWRGFGESSQGDKETSMEVFADDLSGLLSGLQIDRATICGLSMGGYAAFAFFRKYADRVSALILADTKATADTDEGKRGRYETAETVRSKGMTPIIESMIPKLIGETTLKRDPAVVSRVESMMRTAQPEGVAQALIGMAARPDSVELLAKIDCPTLIIVGNEDKLTPPADAEKMSRAIRGSRMVTIADSGHLPNIEQPEKFNQAMSIFLT